MLLIVCGNFIDKEFEKSNYDIEPLGGAVVVWLQGNFVKYFMFDWNSQLICLFFSKIIGQILQLR